MIHARTDYDRIQDPAVVDPWILPPGSTPIGADEPVFLIRAKDICAPNTLYAWAKENDLRGGEPMLSEHVRAWADNMKRWQENNKCKLPDVPKECFRHDSVL